MDLVTTVLLCTMTASPELSPGRPDAGTSTFDGDALEANPGGFTTARTGKGSKGRWLVRKDATAPSAPNVLMQLDTDETDYRFPLAVAVEPSLRDLRVSVRCKAVSGAVDRACGLVARYIDENNYVLARANALENNVNLYVVKDGRRRELEGWDGAVTSGVWHELRLDLRGEHLEVFWDGKRVIDHRDATFSGPGRAGMWTKADSVTAFDDFHVEAL